MALEPIDMMARAELTGKSPLAMHHLRTADPDDELTVAIKEITDKGSKMTPEDRRRKEQLQWRACLYTEELKEGDETAERVIVPDMWLFRALEAGGKTLGHGVQSKGAAVIRSVTFPDPWFALGYDGPQDISELATDQRFRWRTFVNPNPTAAKKRMLPSVRVQFPVPWHLTATVHLVTDMGLGWDDFTAAFRAAGNIGIGDARTMGRGRFTVKLTKLR